MFINKILPHRIAMCTISLTKTPTGDLIKKHTQWQCWESVRSLVYICVYLESSLYINMIKVNNNNEKTLTFFVYIFGLLDLG